MATIEELHLTENEFVTILDERIESSRYFTDSDLWLWRRIEKSWYFNFAKKYQGVRYVKVQRKIILREGVTYQKVISGLITDAYLCRTHGKYSASEPLTYLIVVPCCP